MTLTDLCLYAKTSTYLCIFSKDIERNQTKKAMSANIFTFILNEGENKFIEMDSSQKNVCFTWVTSLGVTHFDSRGADSTEGMAMNQL